MDLWILLSACVLSGVVVAWGLFEHAAAVVNKKPIPKGIIYKFSGLALFLWSVAKGQQTFVVLVLTFFVSLTISLILLALARERLLR